MVGEVRGGEVVDLLAAMNTGHEGGCGTLHANSCSDVPARVEALAMAAGAISGGYLGSRSAQRVPQELVRGAVVVIGLVSGVLLYVNR